MNRAISSAIDATYAFSAWEYKNETEFKHELFHQLAIRQYNGVPLGQVEKGARTPRLHAEGKVENGNPAKADLLMCDPFAEQRFNYAVEHVIELKMSLTATALKSELQKTRIYQTKKKGIWFVSRKPLKLSPDTRAEAECAFPAGVLRIVGPGGASCVREGVSCNAVPSLAEAMASVARCIDKCLNLYGRGKEQFHSYFWCNFEHELDRGHSFPCEGDFNACLYHFLRSCLPDSVRIHSEYRPKSLPHRRIDFVIEGSGCDWAIPVEVKMNWDQFKPKYKNDQELQSEARTIMDRFAHVGSEFPCTSPVLVVIQGKWRRETKMANMENALRDLGLADAPVELVCFDEDHDGIVRSTYGK